MKKDNGCLRYIAGWAVVLLSLVGYALPDFAQTQVGVQPINLNASKFSFGIEGGIGEHTQQGTFLCPCGGIFSGGSGKGFLGSAFFEMTLGRYFSVGINVGPDYKNSTSTTTINDVVIVEPSNSSQFDTVNMNVNRTGVLTMTLLRFAPYIQYQLLGSGFFLQLGPGVSYVLSNNFTQTRNMINNSLTLYDGTTLNNLTFADGTRTETINSGSVSSIQSVLFSGVISAGYGFTLGDFVISPIVTYDLPLSNIQTNSDLRINSIYGSVGVKFKL